MQDSYSPLRLMWGGIRRQALRSTGPSRCHAHDRSFTARPKEYARVEAEFQRLAGDMDQRVRAWIHDDDSEAEVLISSWRERLRGLDGLRGDEFTTAWRGMLGEAETIPHRCMERRSGGSGSSPMCTTPTNPSLCPRDAYFSARRLHDALMQHDEREAALQQRTSSPASWSCPATTEYDRSAR